MDLQGPCRVRRNTGMWVFSPTPTVDILARRIPCLGPSSLSGKQKKGG